MICIWDLSSGQLKTKFAQGVNTRLVRSIAFSADGAWIATASEDEDCSTYIWDASSGAAITTIKGSKDPIQQVGFNPACQDGYEVVTCGKDRVFYYPVGKDGSLGESKKGVFGETKMVDMNCLAFLDDGTLVTGATNGELYVWVNRECKKTVKVGNVGIGAIAVNGKTIIAGSGNDIVTFGEGYAK